jgi:hypothetical protein
MISRQTMGLIGFGLLTAFTATQPANACMTELDVIKKLSSSNSWVFSNPDDMNVFKSAYALKADSSPIVDIDYVRAFERKDKGIVEGVFIKNGCALASVKMPEQEFKAHWEAYLTQSKEALLQPSFTPNMRPA